MARIDARFEDVATRLAGLEAELEDAAADVRRLADGLDHDAASLLTAEERTVLELASVVGRVFDWRSVAALAPAPLAPRVVGVLLALTRRNLLQVADRRHGEDAFSFRHHLLRDAAYQAIPKR